MKTAIYPGTFDPWSFGHQFILDCALEVFDRVYVLAAVNPAKAGALDSLTRARLIAHAIDPFVDWWKEKPPFVFGEQIAVDATEGLVAQYAEEQEVTHLIRGLRSTSDFEAEFNLYFSNRAILPNLQTWAIMCPPELLHCSSTYVRSVIGKPDIPFVGTSFTAQAMVMGHSRWLGTAFDIIQTASLHRFLVQRAELDAKDVNQALQITFSNLYPITKQSKTFETKLSQLLAAWLKKNTTKTQKAVMEGAYPETQVTQLWGLIFSALKDAMDKRTGERALRDVINACATIGRTGVPLFDTKKVFELLK